MIRPPILLLAASALALLGGCGQPAPDASAVPSRNAEVAGTTAPSATPDPIPAKPAAPAAKPPAAPLLGQSIVLAEWRKAANRATCAPLALQSDVKTDGKPRPATFSGGWAVAFDQPDRRSAYGFAGVGALPEDRQDFAVHVDRLARQWPYVRRWDAGQNLPAGSIAGYGLEGAKDYPPGSSGFGQQSVAYLRIPGQQCLYNVWSKLSRDHLELLLDQLALLRP